MKLLQRWLKGPPQRRSPGPFQRSTDLLRHWFGPVLARAAQAIWHIRGELRAALLRKPRHLIDLGEIDSLCQLAERQGRQPEELALALLNRSIEQYQQQETNWLHWQKLSLREQQVAALVCLDFTSHEIAGRLGISIHTVETHVDHILHKFEAANRNEVRKRLADWEFS